MRLKVSADLAYKAPARTGGRGLFEGGVLMTELQNACEAVLTKYGYRPNRLDDEHRVPDRLSIEMEL